MVLCTKHVAQGIWEGFPRIIIRFEVELKCLLQKVRHRSCFFHESKGFINKFSEKGWDMLQTTAVLKHEPAFTLAIAKRVIMGQRNEDVELIMNNIIWEGSRDDNNSCFHENKLLK